MKNRLKEVRDKLGLSLQQLAHICKISKTQIWDLEKQDGCIPKLTTAYRISRQTNHSVRYIWPDETEPCTKNKE